MQLALLIYTLSKEFFESLVFRRALPTTSFSYKFLLFLLLVTAPIHFNILRLHSCITKRWILLFVITTMSTMRLINSGVVKQLADKLGKSTLTSNLKGSCELNYLNISIFTAYNIINLLRHIPPPRSLLF